MRTRLSAAFALLGLPPLLAVLVVALTACGVSPESEPVPLTESAKPPVPTPTVSQAPPSPVSPSLVPPSLVSPSPAPGTSR